jgi:2-polyprenyl-3-methyl-5-hydroxy-6-metoxy-1,4-benzoquinol methylase
VLSPDVVAFVRAALPAPPLRVLEIGAGDGALAAVLAEAGCDVLAVDPAGAAPHVRPLAVADVDEPAGSFDAAVAVVSMHHVEPLRASCRKIAELIRPGGRLIVDEFDVERFDERAARWMLGQWAAVGREATEDAPGLVAALREHIHPVALLTETLADDFALGEPVRGPYLHRWELPRGLRHAEVDLIAAGALPATGARFVGARRASQRIFS